MASPFLLSALLQALLANVIFIGSLLVGKVGQFHRFDGAVDDHGGTETGSQPQEQHLAAFVASQSLHGGVIHDFDRTLERGFKVKSHPAASEVMRFRHQPIPDNHSRVANRDHVILPVAGELLDSRDHLLRCQAGSGRKLPWLLLSAGENFHVVTADIDDQHIHDEYLLMFSAPLFRLSQRHLLFSSRYDIPNQNPKSKARNTKQTKHSNPKSRNRNPKRAGLEFSPF